MAGQLAAAGCDVRRRGLHRVLRRGRRDPDARRARRHADGSSLARINALKNVISGLANAVAAVALRRVRPGAVGIRAAAGGRLPDRRLDGPGHRAQAAGASATHDRRRGGPGRGGQAWHRRLPVMRHHAYASGRPRQPQPAVPLETAPSPPAVDSVAGCGRLAWC